MGDNVSETITPATLQRNPETCQWGYQLPYPDAFLPCMATYFFLSGAWKWPIAIHCTHCPVEQNAQFPSMHFHHVGEISAAMGKSGCFFEATMSKRQCVIPLPAIALPYLCLMVSAVGSHLWTAVHPSKASRRWNEPEGFKRGTHCHKEIFHILMYA